MYREEYKTFRQPCALNDGNCLMASLLACVGTDNERKVLLGFTIDDEVDWHSGEAYQHYRKFCRVSLEDESLGDKSKGVYQWLQHLQKTGKISQYMWKRNRFLEGDLSAWFHNKVQAWAGKDFIVFGYRGDSRKVTEEMERVYETWPSEQAKVGKQTPAVCWRKVAKEWMSDPRDRRAPVDGFRGHDAATLDKLALERTLELGKNDACQTTREWRERTGRSRGSFDRELVLNRKYLWAEGKERVSHNMYCRDCTSTERAKKKAKVSTVPAQEKSAVVAVGEASIEELAAGGKRRAKPKFTVRRRPRGNYWPVSRHGVAMRVVKDGDVVLLDPALQVAHLVSRCDLAKSCRAFLSCLMEYWCVYEFQLEV
eukprot:gene13309-9536_t